MQIFFVGAPGSGKTTVSLHLAYKYNIEHISYRHLIHQYLEKTSKESKKLKKLWLNFKPFPPKEAFSVLKDYLNKTPQHNFVLDGYPKTREEADYLVQWLKLDPKVSRSTFVLDLKKEDIYNRLHKRLVCPSCFYISANPNIQSILGNKCPYCHIVLIQRKDDIPQKIEYRIQRYLKEKDGIIKNLSEVSGIHDINSSEMLAEVINNIVEKIDSPNNINTSESEKGARLLVEGLGLDLANPNTIGTPTRMVNSLQELCKGLKHETQQEIKETLSTVFPTKYKGMIIMEPIKAISICAHHLLPIEYEVLFGYIPKKLTLGFSKIIKAIRLMAAKPVLQEDFTQETIDTFKEVLDPEGIMIVVRGRHSCMSLRGEKSSNINITSALRGVFKTSERTRNEFLTLAKFSNSEKYDRS